ncbi:hypothetical protein KP220_002071 [Salmonella enterica]|uniref:Uncharacterized protein n=1 Tax=Salmonella enterica TaxID=28901 RepID=A0A743N7A5_SALER|nr:hypothetical protein [Salmonella enterica]HAF2097135.1 hypothetical protein [Salmonella enterica]
MKWWVVIFIFIIFSAQAEGTCSQQDFDKADMAISSLNSWATVDDYFSKYSDCDIDYVNEGTSEKIIRLLIDKWEQLNELSALVKRKPVIENYVLEHVNATLDIDDLEKLRDYSASDCYIDNENLCEKLHFSAISALNKLHSFYSK